MAEIKLNGDVIANKPAAEVDRYLQENPDLDLTVEFTRAEIRTKLRSELDVEAGDLASLLGTASDAGGLVLVELLRFATLQAQGANLSEMRAAAQRLADMGADFLAGVDAGEIHLPYMGKGETAVFEEVATRGESVSAVLARYKS